MDAVRPSGGLAVRVASARALVDDLSDQLSNQHSDPFASEIVCIDNPGMTRWVTGQLSRRLGASGSADGICAGVTFTSLSRLVEEQTRDLVGIDVHDDPWTPRRLTASILTTMRDAHGEGWFALVGHHLGAPGDESRPGRWYDTAAHVARLFRRYWTHRPTLLEQWSSSASTPSINADPTQWQAELWRRVQAATEIPDPVARLRQAIALLSDALPATVPSRLFVFNPAELSVRETDFLVAFAQSRPTWVGLVHAPQPGPRHPLVASYGRQATAVRSALTDLMSADSPCFRHPQSPDAEPGIPTVLGAIQSDIVANRRPTPREGLDDDSVAIHLSHGLDRQVEVLREILTGLFADDPTLEPRDVLVVSPSAREVAPLATAGMCQPADAAPRHPGHGLRVRVISPTNDQANPLLTHLIHVLDTVTGRLTVADLYDLAHRAPVARRFRLSPDDIAETFDLLYAAGARWGLDRSDRSRFGLETVDQNTIGAGLDRLLLGIAMSEDGSPLIGGVLPLDGVDSSRITAVGSLAELVDQLSRIAQFAVAQRTVSEWAQFVRDAATTLFDPGPDESWQLSALVATAADLGELADVERTWAFGDLLAFLREAADRTPRHNSFGSGSLMVTDLDLARGVPHRVVVVVGLDEHTFPHVSRMDGDDHLASDPHPLDPDRRRLDHQGFLDAVLAAQERLIIIGQGFDPHTNTRIPVAPAILDLAQAVSATAPRSRESLIVSHGLYPYSAASFTGPVASFDRSAYAAATALPAPPAASWRAGDSCEPAPSAVSLRDLLAFLRHPARELVKVRCGLPVYDSDEWTGDLPIELDGLGRWDIGNRMLTAVRLGDGIESVIAAERARGTVPPGALGDAVIDTVSEQVRSCVAAAETLPQGPTVTHDAQVTIGEWALTGTISTVGNDVRLVRFSSPTPAVRLEAWISLLLLQMADPTQTWTATAVTRSGIMRWTCRHLDPAAHLTWLLRIYQLGLSGPIPLPSRSSLAYVRDMALGRDEQAWAAAEIQWTEETAHDRWWREFYPSFAQIRAHPIPDDLGLPCDSTLFGTLARCVWSPIVRGELR